LNCSDSHFETQTRQIETTKQRSASRLGAPLNCKAGEDLRLHEPNLARREGSGRRLVAWWPHWQAAAAGLEILQPQPLKEKVSDEL